MPMLSSEMRPEWALGVTISTYWAVYEACIRKDGPKLLRFGWNPSLTATWNLLGIDAHPSSHDRDQFGPPA